MTDQNQKEMAMQNEGVYDKPWIKKMGFFLIILSCVLYGGLLLVPFTPFAIGTKTVIYSALVISGEVSFWIGGIILGKELVGKYRRYLNPFHWFKKKSD